MASVDVAQLFFGVPLSIFRVAPCWNNQGLERPPTHPQSTQMLWDCDMGFSAVANLCYTIVGAERGSRRRVSVVGRPFLDLDTLYFRVDDFRRSRRRKASPLVRNSPAPFLSLMIVVPHEDG